MKKWLKIVFIILGVIVLCVGGFVTYISIRGIPDYTAKDPGFKVDAAPEHVANGRRLTTMLCTNCHLDPKTGALTGKFVDDVPDAFGVIYSRNITGHPTKGIGSYTDGQLAYLLRTGIRPDGRWLPPYMPKRNLMSDNDLNDIIAFLRSDDPLVKAEEVASVDCKPSFLTKFLSHVAFKPPVYPTAPVVAPDPKTDKAGYGKYLVDGVVDCFVCHSKDIKTNDIEVPEKSPGYLGGGTELRMRDGKAIKTPNLTMHPENGLGKWTEEEFIKAVRFGNSRGKALHEPMPIFVNLTDEECSAIYAYLKTVPVINNPVDRTIQ